MTELLHQELTYSVIGAAMEVHRELGPGFLEAVYQRALAYELSLRGHSVELERALQVRYKGELVGDYRADMVVDAKLILELKAVSVINKAHLAQAHHYLAATGMELALILNFGAASLEHKRIIRQSPLGSY
jgi:GxxExxY protein